MSDADFDRFAPYLTEGGYKGAIVSSLGHGDENGALTNLATRIVLTLDQVELSDHMAIGRFQVIRQGLRPTDLRELLASRSGPLLPLRNRTLSLRSRSVSAYEWHYDDHGSFAFREIGWHAVHLRGIGDMQSSIAGPQCYSELDRRMISASQGLFGNMLALQRYLGGEGVPLELDARMNSYIDFYAPTYARFASEPWLSLEDHALHVVLDCLPQLRDAVTLYAVHTDLPQPIRLRGGQFKETGPSILGLETALPNLEGPFDLHLVVGDETIERRRVGLPVLSAAIHSLIDEEWTWITGLLAPTKRVRPSDGFQHYLLTILQLMGIPAVHYGFRSLDHAPDLVAQLDDNTFLVGECKVTAPTSAIIELLHTRALSIAQGLWGPRKLAMHQVLFHATPNGSVNPDVARKAQDLGVMLVGHEDLTHLQDRISRGEPQQSLQAALLRDLDR